ncbi:MAG: hypothetical protein D6813_13365 [Calditrichaeota bacterium]|nr:MAG: hypothetical protein D6813_13365 [Calditrichota bacterium]
MKKHWLLFGLLSSIMLGTALSFNLIDFPRGTQVYIKTATENLFDMPGGEQIGTLQKGASMLVLEDSGEWVKVRLEGWVTKKSLTDSKLALKGDGYRALQIIVKERAEAEKILQQLRSGADFRKLAREKSIGPAAAKGGDLGYFNRGDFRPEFESAILKLKPGEISDIIQSEIGYHIFKRIE